MWRWSFIKYLPPLPSQPGVKVIFLCNIYIVHIKVVTTLFWLVQKNKGLLQMKIKNHCWRKKVRKKYTMYFYSFSVCLPGFLLRCNFCIYFEENLIREAANNFLVNWINTLGDPHERLWYMDLEHSNATLL